MAKLEHLHRLFDAHTFDLNEILIKPQEIIGCPICLREFPREAINLKLVNDGHIWPQDIRKKSEKAGQMQVVREYILSSFDKKSEDPEIPKEDNFSLKKYIRAYFPDPMVGFMYPLDSSKPSYLQVSFLSHEVRLPFMYDPSILGGVLLDLKNYVGTQFDKLIEAGEPLFFNVPCAKTVIHECIFDYFNGETIQAKTGGIKSQVIISAH